MADCQIDRNSIRKNIYCSKLILVQSFYCLKLNMLSRHIITLFSQCVMNLFIHLLLNCLCYLSLAFKLFLMFSKICKEYKGAFTLHFLLINFLIIHLSVNITISHIFYDFLFIYLFIFVKRRLNTNLKTELQKNS